MVNDLAVQEFVKAIKEDPQDTNTTYSAIVSHVDDEGVVWVNLEGSEKETPTASTSSEVKAGDSVTVQWRNNKLYIEGNYSNPSAGFNTVAPSVNYVAQLVDKDITVKSITAATGYIEDLTSKNITAEDITADHATIKDLDVESIDATVAYIEDLTAEHITAEDIVADHETVDSLDANYAKINAANVTDLSAQNAWVNKIMVQTGLIAHESDIFTLDAIQVNAANITAGTIDVNRLIVTVGNQKYLVNVDPSTGTPSYEKLDGNIVEPRTITADKIVAHDITVQEITTENLVGTNGWINLNQGKFFFTTNGTTWANTTNGIMWDGTNLKIKGDVSITAGNVYTKTQTDTALGGKVGNDEVITKINASSEGVQIQASKVDITGTTVFSDGTSIQSRIDAVEVGGRNMLVDSDAPTLTKVYAPANRYFMSSNRDGAGSIAVGSNMPSNNLKNVAKFNIPADKNGTNYAFVFYSSNQLSVIEGQEYTLSCYARIVSGAAKAWLQMGSSSYVMWRAASNLTSSWKQYSHTFTYTDASMAGSGTTREYFGVTSASDSACVVELCGFKMEKGNKATDWTPAPEEVQAEIDTKKNTHNLLSVSTEGLPYSTLLGWAKEGTSTNFNINTSSTPITNVKIGDLVRLGIPVSDMGTVGNRPLVYINGVVTAIPDATHVTMTAHGLDTTIIDGGNILTNSIGANQIAAHSIGASLITVSDSTNLATANELYESSLPTDVPDVYKLQIRSGYLTKKTATQQYLMLTEHMPNTFKTGDELYYEFVGKAAVAGTVALRVWGYEGTAGNRTNSINNSDSIAFVTTEKTYSGVIKLSNANWGNKTQYIIGFNDSRDTKSQIYIKNCVIRRKSAGELIVDGSITSNHISSDKIDANKINVGQIQIGDLSGSIGGVNLLSNNKLRKTGTSNGITFAASSTSPAHIKITGTATADVDQWVANLQDITATGMSVTISANAVFSNSTGIYFFVSTTKDGALYKNYKQLTWYSNTERRLTINLESGETLRYLRIFVPSGQTFSGNYRFKVELGNKQTAWTPAQDAYITDIGNDGIRIHSSLTLDDSVVIDSTGMEVFMGGTASANSVAKYGSTARIGKESGKHINLTTTGITLYDGANELASFGEETRVDDVYIGNSKFRVTGNADVVAEIGTGTGSIISGITAGVYYIFCHYQSGIIGGISPPPSYVSEGYGFCALTEGSESYAIGDYSHASGYGVITRGAYQTAIGKFNDNSTSNAFEIGRGTDDDDRKNIFAVTTGGSVNIASSQSYKVNGTVVASARAKTTITPTASGVSNYSSYGNSYYEKAGNVVHVHIGVSGVTANTVTAIYTLPSGYRPTSKVFGHGTGGTSDNIGYMDITTAGVISVRSSSGYIGADVTYFV